MASATLASSGTAAISRSQSSSTLISTSLGVREPTDPALVRGTRRIDALCFWRSGCQVNLQENIASPAELGGASLPIQEFTLHRSGRLSHPSSQIARSPAP